MRSYMSHFVRGRDERVRGCVCTIVLLNLIVTEISSLVVVVVQAMASASS
jgi:hypothetical protein